MVGQKGHHDELKQHKEAHKNDRGIPYFPTGRLDAIIDEVKKKGKIETTISKKFVGKRISRNKITVVTPSSPDSPLAAIEPTILKLILAMADSREPLQPSRCIQVINDLIKDTPSQAKLIDFNNRMNTPIDSTPIQFIGPGYWQSRISVRCMR